MKSFRYGNWASWIDPSISRRAWGDGRGFKGFKTNIVSMNIQKKRWIMFELNTERFKPNKMENQKRKKDGIKLRRVARWGLLDGRLATMESMLTIWEGLSCAASLLSVFLEGHVFFFLPLFHSNHSSFLDSQRLDAARGWEVQSILRPEWFRTGSNVITKTHITIRSETPVLTLKSVEAGKNAHTYLFTAANSWIFQDIFVSAVECRLVAVVSTIPELRASNWNLYFPGIEERDAQSKELSHRLGYLYSRETYPVGCGDIQSGGCHTVNCRVGRRCDFYRFLKEKIPETRTSNWKCVCVCVCVPSQENEDSGDDTFWSEKRTQKKKDGYYCSWSSQSKSRLLFEEQ